MSTKIEFGGVYSGHRVVVVNGVTLHIPESQVEQFLSGDTSGSSNDPLSKMPDMDKLCATLVPSGSVKFTLTAEELNEAKNSYEERS